MSSRLVDTLKQAHALLESLGVEHALLGGMAANLYRQRPRATQDVDFGIKASPADLVRVVDAFREAGWKADVKDSRRETLRLAHADLPRVDILVAGTAFEESAITRAVKLTIDDEEMRIVTPEDLMVYKLVAGRAHDIEAVAAILLAQGTVDEAYVRGWLEQFGVAERWQVAEHEAQRLAEE